METTCTESNMEIDNTEHIRGKRLSSILKAPRIPLDDLGNGNEPTQDINAEKRKKTSRRVSFANTINCRVFQSDVKNNKAETEGAECAADTRSDILLDRSKEPEAVPCEITGMNTLLHGPIQAAVQQAEGQDADDANPRTSRHDTTLIFSGENETDMTASHTVVITCDLKSSQEDQAGKIDVAVFLAGLSSSSGKAGANQEFRFFPDPTNHPCAAVQQQEDATAIKKIDFNEFLMSLKSGGKAPGPVEGPEKDAVFCSPLHVLEDRARSAAEPACSRGPLDDCNVTQLFRAPDDGMEMTRCQGNDVRAAFPPQHQPCADVTKVFVDCGMDITASHTAKVSLPFSGVGNQSLNCQKDSPSAELDHLLSKAASNQLCSDRGVGSIGHATAWRAATQEATAMSAITGLVSSETVFRADKTLLGSDCDDMEITKNCTDISYSDSPGGANGSRREPAEKPFQASSLLAERRHPVRGHGDVGRALMSSGSPAHAPCKARALPLPSGSDEQLGEGARGPRTAAASAGFNPWASAEPAAVSKRGLWLRAADPQLVPVPGEKTVIFSGEEMDLTMVVPARGAGASVESAFPTGAFASATCRPLDDRSACLSSIEQEEMEMTRCHAVVIDDRGQGTTPEAPKPHCQIASRNRQTRNVGASALGLDKENEVGVGVDRNEKQIQAIETKTNDPELLMVEKTLGKPNLRADAPGSGAKSLCLLREQKREVPESGVTGTSASVPLPSRRAVLSQPFGKDLLNPSLSCTVTSAAPGTGIAESCPAAGLDAAQERGGGHDPDSGLSQLLQGDTSVVFPSGENMDLTGDCAVQADTPEGEAGPGCLAGGENKAKPWSEGALMAKDSQEQPECDARSSAPAQKMLPTWALPAWPVAAEQTTVFSDDADMDITTSVTVSAENKAVLQHKRSSDDGSFVSGATAGAVTYGGDMEISRLDGVATAKAASQRVLDLAWRARRKSLKGAGEKTLLFSLSDDNDMDMTKSHTAAISQESLPQSEGGPRSASSAAPVTTGLFPSSRAAVGIAASCSAEPAPPKALCGDELTLEDEVGQQVLANHDATVLAAADMEITAAQPVALEWQPARSAPSSAMLTFTSCQADMELTQAPDDSAEGEFCEARAEHVGREALSGREPLALPAAEDLELATTHTAVLWAGFGAEDQEAAPAPLAAPADKTVVSAHEQDMDTSASHITAVSNDVNGLESHELPQKSSWRPGPQRVLGSSCRGAVDPSCTNEPHRDSHRSSEDKPSVASSASSSAAFPGEKGASGVPAGPAPGSICPASLAEGTVGVQTPQDRDPPVDGAVSSEQDLLPLEDLKAKRAPLEPPDNRPVGHREDSGGLVLPVSLPVQQPESLTGSQDAQRSERSQEPKEGEGLAAGLGWAGTSPALVCDSQRRVSEESEEKGGLSARGEAPPKDLQTDPEQTEHLRVTDSPRGESDPTLAPELSGILSVCSKLRNIRRKSALLSLAEAPVADPGPWSSAQPEGTLALAKPTAGEANRGFYSKEQEDAGLECGAAPLEATGDAALADKYQAVKVPLGIFQPRLPSRRNPSVSSAQGADPKASGKGEAPASGAAPGGSPGAGEPRRHNFSPARFVVEEFLPVCLEEMDSNGSVSSELMESACSHISRARDSHDGENLSEETNASSSQKRAWEQAEEELHSPKKVRRGEDSHDEQVALGAAARSPAEAADAEDPPSASAKSPDSTRGSSGSLDSAKADPEFSIQRSSQMESQLLTDSICEDSLREKFQSGEITVGEFLTLLQVHVPIQKPRHSHIPASGAVGAPSAPEDLIDSQYIYRPKLRIYEEDCQALAQQIEELKLYVSVQDQLLVSVNKSLWEVMRTCSEEELRTFGAELNKMKSCFAKESKILAHNEKATLYGRLLQSAQEQRANLRSRMERVDELFKEAESCIAALEADPDWEEWKGACGDGAVQGKTLEEELEILKAQEEKLQRELSELEVGNEQMLAQMDQLKEREGGYWELLESCDVTEWEVTEWSEQQAVFTFLYDSVELTIAFGPPVDGDEFGQDPARKILSLTFESFLDEEKAPPSSRLVQRLIFQCVESQGCWQEKCPTLHHLPQVLGDVSLVVSRCKTLGEEIEFLERWGGKFNLLGLAVSDTQVKLLFSSSTAFAKFELTLALSADYPAAPLPFTVQKHIGSIGEEEITAVVSSVPAGHHYLRRTVSAIHHSLLRDPR